VPAVLRVLGALLCGLLLICPVCRRGRMSRSLFRLRERCPSCGVVFERDPGEMTGGMAINMVLTSILGVAGAIYGALFSGLAMGLVAVLLAVATVGFALCFHRHARGLWVGLLHVTGAIGER
jgi:uncharacterized protein (DUF983 family)